MARAAMMRKAVFTAVRKLALVPTTLPDWRYQPSGSRNERFAVDTVQPFRLVLEAGHELVPRKKDGGKGTEQVNAITILDVVDCRWRRKDKWRQKPTHATRAMRSDPDGSSGNAWTSRYFRMPNSRVDVVVLPSWSVKSSRTKHHLSRKQCCNSKKFSASTPALREVQRDAV